MMPDGAARGPSWAGAKWIPSAVALLFLSDGREPWRFRDLDDASASGWDRSRLLQVPERAVASLPWRGTVRGAGLAALRPGRSVTVSPPHCSRRRKA